MAKYLVIILKVQVRDFIECDLSVNRLLITVPYS
jgi:hypothetical protein